MCVCTHTFGRLYDSTVLMSSNRTKRLLNMRTDMKLDHEAVLKRVVNHAALRHVASYVLLRCVFISVLLRCIKSAKVIKRADSVVLPECVVGDV